MTPGILDIYAQGLSGTKRKVFFSFHYADIMRVNNVRKSGEFKTEDHYSGRDVQGYYDRSLWESRKTEGDDAVKNLIRTGVQNTSVVCVLIGSKTWQRRWVRYEIARSVIDGKGILGVHINGLNHHQHPYGPHELGDNPLRYIGIGKAENGNYYLCERVLASRVYEWAWYKDYTSAVSVPAFMKPPLAKSPLRLSEVARLYDWTNDGHRKIGTWIDTAAQAAGR